jgi:hypothetical protein
MSQKCRRGRRYVALLLTPVRKLTVPDSCMASKQLTCAGGAICDAITVAIVELSPVRFCGIPLIISLVNAALFCRCVELRYLHLILWRHGAKILAVVGNIHECAIVELIDAVLSSKVLFRRV